MTSVPAPLKFLRPHLQTLKETYAKLAEGDNKRLLADIISLLAMTDAPVDNVMPESLKYRLVGSDEDIGTWGHEVGRRGEAAKHQLDTSHPFLACVLCASSSFPTLRFSSGVPLALQHTQRERDHQHLAFYIIHTSLNDN